MSAQTLTRNQLQVAWLRYERYLLTLLKQAREERDELAAVATVFAVRAKPAVPKAIFAPRLTDVPDASDPYDEPRPR